MRLTTRRAATTRNELMSEARATQSISEAPIRPPSMTAAIASIGCAMRDFTLSKISFVLSLGPFQQMASTSHQCEGCRHLSLLVYGYPSTCMEL